jgi:hypothetical protein
MLFVNSDHGCVLSENQFISRFFKRVFKLERLFILPLIVILHLKLHFHNRDSLCYSWHIMKLYKRHSGLSIFYSYSYISIFYIICLFRSIYG